MIFPFHHDEININFTEIFRERLAIYFEGIDPQRFNGTLSQNELLCPKLALTVFHRCHDGICFAKYASRQAA